MRAWSGLKLMTLLALVLMTVGLPIAVAQGQRRTSRRVTNPVRSRPVTRPAPTPAEEDPTDPTLVSTADEPTAEQPTPAKRVAKRPPAESPENTRKLDQLSEEFTRMNRKLDALEKERQADLLQERLTRTEQRAEALRQQLTQTLEKQADLQARTEQIDYDLRPESIQLRAATIPSLHADDVRTQIQRQLENDKKRVRAQLDVIDATRNHLETAIAGADAEVERLRARLNEMIDRNFPAGGGASSTPTPTPAPSTPPPAS